MRLLLAGVFLTVVTFPAAGAGPWYYCDPLGGYYPFVGKCPVPWHEVDPRDGAYGPTGGSPPDPSEAGSPPARWAPALPDVSRDTATTLPQSEGLVSTNFLEGQADRQGWEAWLRGLRGDYRAGAEYWAAYRRSPGAKPCSAAPTPTDYDWTTGCFEAQQRLTSFDERRQTDSQYRLGWDNPPSFESSVPSRETIETPVAQAPDREPLTLREATGGAVVQPAPPPAPNEATEAPVAQAPDRALPASRETAEAPIATPDPYSRDVAELPVAQIPGRAALADSDVTEIPAVEAPARVPAHDVGSSRIERGWLGVRTQEVTPEIAESLGLPKAAGALIVSVAPGSPARRDGIKPGDVITAYRGHNIARTRDLDLAVAATPPGQAVKIKLWRDGHGLTVTPMILAMAGSPEPPSHDMAAGRVPKHGVPQASAGLAGQKPKMVAGSHDGGTFIDQWSGVSTLTTRPFHADGPWEIQWATSSGPFVIELAKPGGKSDVIANQTHQASSSSVVPEGGDYYLKVIANSPWSIKLVSVPPAAVADRTVGAAVEGYDKTLDGEYKARYGHNPTAEPQMAALNASPMRHAHENGQEDAVIHTVHAAMEQYRSGKNPSQQGAARPMRAHGLCEILSSHSVQNWVGTVETVTRTEKGRGVLSVEIAPGILVRTWNNTLADSADHTLIDPSSAVFGSLSGLRAGQKVLFSGTFPASDTDCIEETGLTAHDSLTGPQFIMNFQSVAPIE
jgi:membrane-associated protease RseP (regulator of RpoE activity)